MQTTLTALKENGMMTSSPEEVKARWWKHFNQVFNIRNEYHQEVVDGMPDIPMQSEFHNPPSEEEVLQALSRLWKGKASGKTGIIRELLVYGGVEVQDRLLEAMAGQS